MSLIDEGLHKDSFSAHKYIKIVFWWKAVYWERIQKPCSAWKKAGLVEISLTPGNYQQHTVQALRNRVNLKLKCWWGTRWQFLGTSPMVILVR